MTDSTGAAVRTIGTGEKITHTIRDVLPGGH
jgi:hypothetical protein